MKAKLSKSDLVSFNLQYGNCIDKTIEEFHDRFIIIDENELYHLGTSLNSTGKKIFAITKMNDENILTLIKKKL